MRFGVFMAPFHPTGQNPTLALERDLQLLEHLDQLGFHEAWIGEHHSGGYEIISSPEVFIAAAAARTKYLRLGSGVNSLPYHHPLLLADRFVLLDHLTRGRAMLGCGPGQLTSDAHMLGIPADEQRPRMNESLDAIMALLKGETVTMHTDGFTLQDARLQLRPYSEPNLEVAVAASISPTGAVAAGKHGIGLLSIAATTSQGFDAIGTHWKTWSETAEQHGHVADRSKWRLVGPMHIA
ncbi:MAG TPA: LLM class flavin-dependent oxidoreductase, partial [Acidimicrobiia bacterium]|nr:LLM class flavin-dependent oxidoreductase [Acidimicrobiia bacterium]